MKWFQTFIILSIIINTITLAMDKYPPPPPAQDAAFQTLNLVFTTVFTVELVLKVVGLGFLRFARDKFNIFDTLVVIVSLAELAL